jgi:hypothetical protein
MKIDMEMPGRVEVKGRQDQQRAMPRGWVLFSIAIR